MDDLRAILDILDGQQLEYVYERSRCKNVTETLAKTKIPKSTYYAWPNREELDQLANEVRRNRFLMAEPKLNDAIEDAVKVLIELLKATNEQVRLNAAKTIIERVMGPVTARVDVTTGGERLGLSADVLAALDQRAEAELAAWETDADANGTE